MTEEEAKTKWCPHVNIAFDPQGDLYFSRSNKLPDASRCVGSACMAWRWAGYSGGQTTVHVVVQMDEKTVATETVSETPPKRGYCGLAGRP